MIKALAVMIAGTIVLCCVIDLLAVTGRRERLRQDKEALLEWEGDGGSAL